jgi:hypothetical protein
MNSTAKTSLQEMLLLPDDSEESAKQKELLRNYIRLHQVLFLDLDNFGLRNLSSLIHALPQSSIRELSLTNNLDIEHEEMKKFLVILPFTNVTSLWLDCTNFQDNDLQVLGSVLNKTSLTEIYLRGNQLTDLGVHNLLNLLKLKEKNMPLSLEKIDISENSKVSTSLVLALTQLIATRPLPNM